MEAGRRSLVADARRVVDHMEPVDHVHSLHELVSSWRYSCCTGHSRFWDDRSKYHISLYWIGMLGFISFLTSETR